MQHVRSNQQVVLLLFPDLLRLWSFAQSLGSRTLEVDTRINGVLCRVSDADLVRALSKYDARLQQDRIEEPGTRWSLS